MNKIAATHQFLPLELGTCHRFVLCAHSAYQRQHLLSMVSSGSWYGVWERNTGH